MTSIISWFESHAFTTIVLGTFLIAAGGWVATWGWNAQTSAESLRTMRAEEERRLETQRTALKQTLALELTMIEIALRQPAYNGTDETVLGKVSYYPPLKQTAIEAALASGLFANRPEDEALYLAITRLQVAVLALESSTAVVTQDIMRINTIPASAESRSAAIVKSRQVILESRTLETTRKLVAELRAALTAAGAPPLVPAVAR